MEGDGASPQRAALKAWLTSDRARPAPRVEAATPAAADAGMVSAPIRQGSLLLVPAKPGEAPGPVRLVWAAADPERIRPVPAGTYRVAHYSLEAEHEGKAWILSASGPGGREVRVEPGRETRIDLDLRVRVKTEAKAGPDRVRVNLRVQGDHHMGLTVSCEGVLTPVAFALVVEDGRDLHREPMAYG